MVLRVYVRGFWPVTLKLNFYDYEVVIFGKCLLTLTAFFGIKLNLKNGGILSIQFYKTIDYKFRLLEHNLEKLQGRWRHFLFVWQDRFFDVNTLLLGGVLSIVLIAIKFRCFPGKEKMRPNTYC